MLTDRKKANLHVATHVDHSAVRALVAVKVEFLVPHPAGDVRFVKPKPVFFQVGDEASVLESSVCRIEWDTYRQVRWAWAFVPRRPRTFDVRFDQAVGNLTAAIAEQGGTAEPDWDSIRSEFSACCFEAFGYNLRERVIRFELKYGRMLPADTRLHMLIDTLTARTRVKPTHLPLSPGFYRALNAWWKEPYPSRGDIEHFYGVDVFPTQRRHYGRDGQWRD